MYKTLFHGPGVLEANPVAYENALRLALCGCAIDKEVGVQLMAAYLLQFMQSRGTHYNNNHGNDNNNNELYLKALKVLCMDFYIL